MNVTIQEPSLANGSAALPPAAAELRDETHGNLFGLVMSKLASLKRLIIAAALVLVPAHSAAALDAVSIQLKWKHQFQFAGYYQALEQGFYRDAGLEVTIREG